MKKGTAHKRRFRRILLGSNWSGQAFGATSVDGSARGGPTLTSRPLTPAETRNRRGWRMLRLCPFASAVVSRANDPSMMAG